MPLLEVINVSKQEEGVSVLNNVSFSQEEGQKLSIAGATGSGKTSLLKMIGGLSAPGSGTILFNGERIKGPDERLIPGHPSIAYLSQYFELRNHYRVKDFLSMASKVSEEAAFNIYQVCRIHHLLERWTHQLSGGEKQRIALARLLIASPSLLLLDEPYSNLDPFHKHILKAVIHDVSDALKMTCILVSHDPLDALSWADEILVLKQGELVQKDNPETVYRKPVDDYTASLFGKYNRLSPLLRQVFCEKGDAAANEISTFVRPENIRIISEGDGVAATVEQHRFMGSFHEIEADVSGERLTVHTQRNGLKKGSIVYLSLSKA